MTGYPNLPLMNLRQAAEYYRERAKQSTKSWPIAYDFSKGWFVCECGGEGSGSNYRDVVHKPNCPFDEAERVLADRGPGHEVK